MRSTYLKTQKIVVFNLGYAPSLVYFKQYLFAIKSRRYSTIPSSTLTTYPEDQRSPISSLYPMYFLNREKLHFSIASAVLLLLLTQSGPWCM